MKLIIDIPEKIIETLKIDCLDFEAIHEVEMAIKDGTVLPKGHGDLIDRDTIHLGIEKFHSKGDWETANWEVQFAEVVIPADKKENKE